MPALVSGSVAGLLSSATVACLFLTVEIVPRMLWSAFVAAGIDFGPVWFAVALVGWAVAGAAIGFVLSAAIPIRRIVYPPIQRFVAALFGLCGLRGLGKRFGPLS